MKNMTNRNKNRIIIELIILSVVAVIVFLVSGKYDCFEIVAELSRAHEDQEIDEIVITCVYLSVALLIFSIRRLLEARELHKNLETQNRQLAETMEELRQLRGIIPICSSCKAIRDEDGSWYPVEVYVRERSEADFSHSICPECVKRLYPEYTDS